VFFKSFTGGGANGAATGHLFQDNPGTPGELYTLTGWAGAEANFLAERAEFAIEFLDAGNNLLGATVLDLLAAGLLTDNGLPFDYKEYMVAAVAPAGTATVRVRASFINGTANPAGGGQAFVVDDFTLTSGARVPEPGTLALIALGMIALVRASRRRT
jgi:hypothetical protein